MYEVLRLYLAALERLEEIAELLRQSGWHLEDKED